MIRHSSTDTINDSSRPRRLTRGLQALLWSLWTLAVVSGGAWGWWSDTIAGRPLNLLGMAIDAILVGVIGLIVLTKIEMKLEPWRFLVDRASALSAVSLALWLLKYPPPNLRRSCLAALKEAQRGGKL